MQLVVTPDAESLAEQAAAQIATAARRAVGDRGVFTLAVSGGRTPRRMLELLAGRDDVEWDRVHLFQVDERVAPAGHADRNLTMLDEALLAHVEPAEVHSMPVDAPVVGDLDLDAAAAAYEDALRSVTGEAGGLDLVQLGLGRDGHTASLVPGDPVLDEVVRQVAPAGPYQDRRRLTLTRVALDRARRVLWVVAGADKSRALTQLLAGDVTIPATLVARDRALVLADRAATTGPLH